MRISLSKNAAKFLNELPDKDKNKIREKVRSLVYSIEQYGNIPFKELHIKTLEGVWRGCLRMRIGKIRIIFKIDRVNRELIVYGVDFRGNVYK
ncbi:type II toxin-antitoxin system RelE/ParE family toxin [Melioribacteraceae bacterium 4301-Me]|uniref:type II toxin-antitoxin system RelE family toxin n=1 Tax=Pyranulibacter aquaticus TaxID=3163344 RepID=UPI0035978DF5